MKRRIIALLTAAMLLMAICPAAFADPATPPITKDDIIVSIESVAPATMGVGMRVKITADPKITTGKLTLNSVEATAGVLNKDITVEGETSTELGKYNSVIDVVFQGIYKGTISGSAIEIFKLKLTYTDANGKDYSV